jgi:hypothetical protein
MSMLLWKESKIENANDAASRLPTVVRKRKDDDEAADFFDNNDENSVKLLRSPEDDLGMLLSSSCWGVSDAEFFGIVIVVVSMVNNDKPRVGMETLVGRRPVAGKRLCPIWAEIDK